jgi:hypothetical protein
MRSVFNPIDCLAIAFRSLASVAELGQAFDGGFVFFQVQAVNHLFDWIIGPGQSRGCSCSSALLRENRCTDTQKGDRNY